jgi:hypothetical protein
MGSECFDSQIVFVSLSPILAQKLTILLLSLAQELTVLRLI